MRIIPKRIKVRSNVWKCYSMKDIFVALVVFAVVFVLITAEQWILAIILGLIALVMLMPTGDGIFYSYIFENIKFAVGKKKYRKDANHEKEKIDAITELREIKENGILVYKNGCYGRVVKLGQKNFKIEDEMQQDIDIEYFANALKMLEETQSAELVKIDRPVTLDKFSSELFQHLNTVKASNFPLDIKDMRMKVINERIDRIDELNNVMKQYASEYYIVIYGRDELDLDNTAVNMAAEINKCGLHTKVLSKKPAAIFLKYCYFRNFDEREINEIEDDKLIEWIKPKDIEFKSNKYTVDGIDASIISIAEYPLRVKNAWGANLFNIPNTKVVMHIRPVDKQKAIRRIDKCIGEMELKQITSEQASEANTAHIHRTSMNALLDSLQAENESLLDVTLTVTAYNYLNDPNYKRSVRRSIMTGNFKLSMMHGLQLDAFKAADISPVSHLGNYENGINSSSLAAVFPFVRSSVLDEDGIMLGENIDNRSPFFLNIWKRGSMYQNSNAMIIGQSGAGKSFFLKTLILNEWSNGTRIIVLDPEAEYLTLVRNLNCGEKEKQNRGIIDVGNAKEGRINPFHIYKILTEDGCPAEPSVTFNTHLKMLESFFKIVLVGASSDIVELINNLTVETYKRKGITEATDCTEFKAADFPIFSDLLDTLHYEMEKRSGEQFSHHDYRTADLYLQKFVTGRYSDIWNAPSTLEVEEDIIDFNFQALFANKNNIVANAQMLLVFRFIEQEIINAREANKYGKNLRTMIIVDEAHLYLDAKYPIALDFFFSMSKRIRKYNGSFIPATQNIADWNANEELRAKTSAILKNSQYMFIFKLSAPDMKDVIEVYKAGNGFNKDEQKMIMSAVTGQAFFIGSSELRTGVKISAGGYMQKLFDESKVGGEKDEKRQDS